jgi:hypothetical protein
VFQDWLDKPALDLTQPLAQLAIDKWARMRSATLASRAVTYFKPLAKWAARRGLMRGGFGELERPAQAAKKQLVLSQADVGELLRSLDRSSRGIAVRVMLLTGARCNEACKAIWSEFDLDRGVWTLPGSRRKNSKPGRLMPDHVIPLPAGLVALLRTIGEYHIEISGLAMPQSPEASRICSQDLNEVIAAYVQDRPTMERGLFDEETAPEELTQVRMGAIIRDRYPDLSAEDQEAVRQHAIAAINLTQQGKAAAAKMDETGERQGNTALIDGVRRYAMDVRELDVDLIDRINPFGEAYADLVEIDERSDTETACRYHRGAENPDDARRGARAGAAGVEVQE